MIQRALLRTLVRSLSEVPAVCLLGPRQVGKTTLALEASRKLNANYLMTWTEADKVAENDWVMFRRADGGGIRLRLNGVDCILFENEKGIKASLPRPDVVY